MGFRPSVFVGRFGRFPPEERGALEKAYDQTLRAAVRRPGFVTGLVFQVGLALYFLLRSMSPGPVTWDMVRAFLGLLLTGAVVATLAVLVVMAVSRKARRDYRSWVRITCLIAIIGPLCNLPSTQWEFIVYAAITVLGPSLLIEAVAVAGVLANRDRTAGPVEGSGESGAGKSRAD